MGDDAELVVLGHPGRPHEVLDGALPDPRDLGALHAEDRARNQQMPGHDSEPGRMTRKGLPPRHHRRHLEPPLWATAVAGDLLA